MCAVWEERLKRRLDTYLLNLQVVVHLWTIFSIKDPLFWRCFKKYFIKKNFWALCAPHPSASASQPQMLVTYPDVSPIPLMLVTTTDVIHKSLC